MHGICQTYSSIWNDWFIRAKKTTELSSQVRTRMYRSLPMLGTWYHSSKCIFYPPEAFFLVYTRYIPGIYFSHRYSRNIPGIYPQYDFQIKSWLSSIRIHILLQWVCAVYRAILLLDEESILQCNTMVHRTAGYNRNIPGICTVYARHIIHQFGMIDLSEQRKRRNCHHESELVCTDHYQCWGHDIIHQNAFSIQHECLTGLYQVYTKYIHIISLMPGRHFASLPGLPSAPGCLRPGLSTDLFRLGHWKSSNSRLAPGACQSSTSSH